MCGIAGFVSKKKYADEQILKNMLNRISHRGPDDQGIYVNKNIKLGHRRLTVIDPEGGRQPMIYKQKKDFVIIYNGEIYNTDKLRENLIILGENFETKSDTEVVLKSYVHWGNEFLFYPNMIIKNRVFHYDLDISFTLLLYCSNPCTVALDRVPLCSYFCLNFLVVVIELFRLLTPVISTMPDL